MRYALMVAMILAGSMAALAQDGAGGRTPNTSAGRAGQRATPDQPTAGIVRPGPINSRIQNRVQSRIRNRIDRLYDPRANAESPFRVASEQARTAGRTTRR